MIINPATFIESDEQKTEGFIDGTVEVTLAGDTRRLRASKWLRNGNITAYSSGQMFARYRTGGKDWPAMVEQRTTANGEVIETVEFGRDDRVGRFQKLNMVFFR